MSPLRRTLGLALLLLVALTACRKREEGPGEARTGAGAAPGAVKTEAVGGDLPGGATVVVSVYDLESLWTKLKSTQLYAQLGAIPEIKQKLDPAQNPQLGQGLTQFRAVAGVPLNEQTLFHTLGKKWQLGVYPGSQGDTTAPRLVFIGDMADKDAVGSIFNNLRTAGEQKGHVFKAEKFKGVDVTVVSDSGGVVRGLYGFHKEKLVAANDQAGLESAINALDGEGATMAKDTLYQRALPHVGEANVTMFVRGNASRVLLNAMDRARARMGRPAATSQQERMLAVGDKYNIQSAVVVGSRWSDQGLEVRSYSLLNPASPGAAPLRDMLKTSPSEVEVVGYFPDSTLGLYAVNFLDAPKIYDYAVAYLKDVAVVQDSAGGGATAAQVDSSIAAFERESGMNVRNDILGWMGKEAALGLNGVVKGGFFPIPEISLVIQTTDAARTQAFFQKLETQLGTAMQRSPQSFPVQFQQEDYKGVKVRWAPTPMGEGLAPAYAIHDDYVVVALSRATLKRMLDVKTGAAQPVRSSAAFQSLSGFLPSQANLVGYLNAAQLWNEIGGAVTTFQQMSGKQATPQEQDTLTRVLQALRNIQSVGTYGLNDASGIEQRILVKVQ